MPLVPWQRAFGGSDALADNSFVCKHPQEAVPNFLGMLFGVGTCC